MVRSCPVCGRAEMFINADVNMETSAAGVRLYCDRVRAWCANCWEILSWHAHPARDWDDAVLFEIHSRMNLEQARQLLKDCFNTIFQQ
jgi:hypothetical protein